MKCERLSLNLIPVVIDFRGVDINRRVWGA